jgi:hypothetical protein
MLVLPLWVRCHWHVPEKTCDICCFRVTNGFDPCPSDGLPYTVSKTLQVVQTFGAGGSLLAIHHTDIVCVSVPQGIHKTKEQIK